MRLGSVFHTLAMLCISQAWRPATKLMKTAVLAAGMLIMLPAHCCGVAMRTMLIEEGEAACGKNAGKGELNAAMVGLTSLVGVLAPLFWGRLTLYFSAAAARGGGALYQPGGQFIVAGAMRSLVWGVLLR
jgi:hypothetical protein